MCERSCVEETDDPFLRHIRITVVTASPSVQSAVSDTC